MKLWQKVYLATMILFVVLLNVGMYVVFELTYQKDITVEQKQAEEQYNMLASGLARSVQSLYSHGGVTDAKLRRVVEKYENYYEDEIYLTLWKEATCVYPKDAETVRDWEAVSGKNELAISGKDKKKITIQGKLYDGEETLYLCYEKELTQLAEIWGTLQVRYLVISLSFSFVLAMFLFVVLKKTMKPIDDLTRVVDHMAEGKLESRAAEYGRDEIATLGRHFNQMADKIQENIQLIQREAEAKQEFVDNFAHELKSPLTSIYGFAEYIQKAKVSEEEKIQCMSYIMDESHRLLQLSYTLLAMAKIRKEEVQIEEVDLCEVDNRIASRMDALCKERGVTLECNRSVDVMWANEVLLDSLLCNLIQNAVYACESGDTVLWGAQEEGEHLRVYVKDTGCGMTAEQVKRVKEPFYRVDKARSREAGRTGLGLALCVRIVEYHNGRMEILSEPNKGTAIHIRFPRKFTV